MILRWPFVRVIHHLRFITTEAEGFPLCAAITIHHPQTGSKMSPFPHPLLVRARNHRQALSEEGCRNAPGLFLREASETDLIKVVKSLDKTNRVPGGRGDNTNTSASYSSSPAWLVSRLTGGSGDGGGGGGGGVAEQKGGEGKGRREGMSPHALASALVYFLHRLPEPLLTFQRREAFLACEVGRGGSGSGRFTGTWKYCCAPCGRTSCWLPPWRHVRALVCRYKVACGCSRLRCCRVLCCWTARHLVDSLDADCGLSCNGLLRSPVPCLAESGACLSGVCVQQEASQVFYGDVLTVGGLRG